MWGPIAQEMGVPWRTVEAMHWQMGREEMVSRARVTEGRYFGALDGDSGGVWRVYGED